MNTRACKQCGELFTPLRKDAVFCSNTCRWAHWKANKDVNSLAEKKVEQKPAVSKSLHANLQGVISNEPGFEEKEMQSINPDWTVYTDKKGKLNQQIDQLKQQLNVLKQAEQQVKNETGDWMILAGFLGGAISGQTIGSQFDRQVPIQTGSKKGTRKLKKDNTGSWIGFLIGSIGGGMIGNSIRKMTEKEREEKKKKALENLNEQKKKLVSQAVLLQESIMQITNALSTIPKYITVKERKLLSSAPVTNLLPSPTLAPEPIETQKSLDYTEPASEKIISSAALEKMDYKALNFQDKWAYFFGYPSINFHCVVHGMSGEGKSTFAIQFANYLAENFGTVIYVSGEEGFSKTFKDKFVNNKATSANLFVADLRKLDAVLSEVPNDQFNFIFIDSLDNMRIDADGMKKLRDYYKDSALITISQSTKEGKMRGSYEIVHDSDIAVKVENGVATTTKNRFKEKGLELDVFNKH